MRRLATSIALLALALGSLTLAACGGGEEDDSGGTTTAAGEQAGCATVEQPAPKDERFDQPGRALDPGEPASATVDTSCGSFVIELDTKRSPQTANSFAFLAEQGFYDDTTFHRIVPGFVIQGGDPRGDGTGGPGYSVREPPPQRTTYRTGLVAMAKTGIEPPGTSGSQFFVVTAPADAGLPPDYAVLGEVSEGLDVARRIGALDTDPSTEKPLSPVTIDSVTIDAG
jgi:cyclophilin family peptidyl-prolyl cis-trans isomerase